MVFLCGETHHRLLIMILPWPWSPFVEKRLLTLFHEEFFLLVSSRLVESVSGRRGRYY